MFTFAGSVSFEVGVAPYDYIPYNVMREVKNRIAQLYTSLQNVFERAIEKLQTSVGAFSNLDFDINQIA